jgi:hypothetical protein
MAKPVLAIAMLGLMWVAIQFDVHNAIGRLIISPMAKVNGGGDGGRTFAEPPTVAVMMTAARIPTGQAP